MFDYFFKSGTRGRLKYRTVKIVVELKLTVSFKITCYFETKKLLPLFI